MNKDKKVFGFEIFDKDYVEGKEQFMIYTLNNKMLKPVLRKFELGWKELFDFQTFLGCLRYNDVSKLYTYHPNVLETLCSFPYELNDNEELKKCELDGKWNRFYHLEIFFSGKKTNQIMKNNIEIIHLTKEEVRELEGKLKFHY
jgi:hypothetical protein